MKWKKLQPRPYQKADYDSIVAGIEETGIRQGVISWPTGLGKTVLQIMLLEGYFTTDKYKTIMMAPNKSLIHQHALRIKQMHGGVSPDDVGIVMGRHNEIDKRLIVASVPTLVERQVGDEEPTEEDIAPILKSDLVIRRDGTIKLKQSSSRKCIVSKRFDQYLAAQGLPDAIIYDECHASLGDGSMLMHARLNELADILGVPAPFDLGFTATPVRYDQRALRNRYSAILAQRSIGWAQNNGWLAPFNRVERVSILQEDTGDRVELKAVDNWDEMIVKAYQEKLNGSQTLVFIGQINGVGAIDCSIRLRRAFEAAGISAAHVDGTLCEMPGGRRTGVDGRQNLFDAFENGDIQVITNYNVLTQGIDLPCITSIIFARRFGEHDDPNVSAMTQAIGRGLRLYEGKQGLDILEMTGQRIEILEGATLAGDVFDINRAFEQVLEDESYQDDENRVLLEEDQDIAFLAAERSNNIVGKNVTYDPLKIIRRSNDDWFTSSNTRCQTLPVGEKTVWVISPPNMRLARRVLKALRSHQSLPQDVEKKTLEILELIENFTLWQIRGRGLDRIAYDPSLSLLIDKSHEFLNRVPDEVSAFRKKGRSWKRKPASDKQLAYLKRRLKQVGYSFDPLPDTMGRASQAISHCAAHRVDTLYDSRIYPMVEQLLKDSLGENDAKEPSVQGGD